MCLLYTIMLSLITKKIGIAYVIVSKQREHLPSSLLFKMLHLDFVVEI